MKYVLLTVKEEQLGFVRVYPFIFPEYVVHANVSEYMIYLLGMKEHKSAKVLSAGSCVLRRGEYIAGSGSVSMDIKGSPARSKRDQRLLNMTEALQGICISGVDYV